MSKCTALTLKGFPCRNFAKDESSGLCHCHMKKKKQMCEAINHRGKKCTSHVTRTGCLWCKDHERMFLFGITQYRYYLPTDNFERDKNLVMNINHDFRLGSFKWLVIHHLKASVRIREIELFRKKVMASRIKRAFCKAISDPSYKMCRTRLVKEFECLVNTV